MKKIFLLGTIFVAAFTLSNSITFAAPASIISSDAPTCVPTSNVTAQIIGDKVSIQNHNDKSVNVRWEVWGTNDNTGKCQKVGGGTAVIGAKAERKYPFSCPSNISGLWVEICNVN